MNLQLLTLVPVVASLIWVICKRLIDGRGRDALLLGLVGLATITDMVTMFFIIHDPGDTNLLNAIQGISSSLMVPLLYLFFTLRLGRSITSGASCIIWLFAALSTVPNAVISLDGAPAVLEDFLIKPSLLYFVKGGHVIYRIYIVDLVIVLQTITTLVVFVPTVLLLGRYGLKMSGRIAVFFSWWVVTAAFIISVSVVPLDTIAGSAGSWAFFIFMAILSTSLNTMLALGFDLYPVKSRETGAVIEDPVSHINNYKLLNAAFKTLIDEDKVYLNKDYKSSDAASAIGTTRNFLTYIVETEYGCTFAELMNRKRIEHAKTLLATTMKPITSIAEECGFNDPSYMSRKFTSEFGISPKQWRMKNTNYRPVHSIQHGEQ